jgi:hypothetical protein
LVEVEVVGLYLITVVVLGMRQVVVLPEVML